MRSAHASHAAGGRILGYRARDGEEPTSMEMQQVRYFLALTRTLNFTRAAEVCNVSQPALTRQIQQLEAELGGPLFHRERQNTHLSELGRMMLPYIEAIQEQVEAVKASSLAVRRLEGVTLRVGAMCTIGPALLSELFIRFRESNPEVDFLIRDGSLEEVLAALGAGELDLALLAAPDGLTDSFHGLDLFQERFVVAVAPTHHLAVKNTVRCADLDRQAYVNRVNCEYFDYISVEFGKIGVRTRKVFASERDDWVQGMIKAGLGFGLFPEASVTDPELMLRPLTDPEFVRTTQLVTVRGRPHSPAVGAFVRQARTFSWPRLAPSATAMAAA
jgi:DNA-binding transcriptional LysR family regulator